MDMLDKTILLIVGHDQVDTGQAARFFGCRGHITAGEHGSDRRVETTPPPCQLARVAGAT